MTARRKPKRHLGPATVRYLRQLRLGLDGPTATLAVALEIGLQANVVSMRPDGVPIIKVAWTLEEMDALMVLREMHLGGSTDGAAKWPHYIDGPVSPP